MIFTIGFRKTATSGAYIGVGYLLGGFIMLSVLASWTRLIYLGIKKIGETFKAGLKDDDLVAKKTVRAV
jgi:hypothetical protein